MKKIRVGVIGAGAIAHAAHIPGYLKSAECELVAIADPRDAVAEEISKLVPIARRERPMPKIYGDHREMLDAEKLDAISICTPNVFHSSIFIDCVKKVRYILLEKPVAITRSEAESMREAAEREKVGVMVAFSHRFNPKIVMLRSLLQEGRIGDPYHLRIRFAHQGPIPGWARTDWFYRPDMSGGGALLDMGIHAFDLARWLVGEATSVMARVATLRKPIPVDDNAIIVLEVGSKCMVTIEVGWTSPSGFVGVEAMGDQGSVIVNYSEPSIFLSVGSLRPDGTQSVEHSRMTPTESGSAWERQMDYFINAIRGGGEMAPGIHDGIAALDVALASLQSAKNFSLPVTGNQQ